jgi:hypothetical protein
MARLLSPPQFPLAPKEYSQQYHNEIVRVFSVFLNQYLSPGEGRHTALTLTALQTDDVGLETGALFQQEGFVKIALANVPHVRGSSATGSVGIVDVVIT